MSNRKEREKERDKGKEKGKSGETGGEKGRQSEVVRPKEKQNLAPPKNKQSARKLVLLARESHFFLHEKVSSFSARNSVLFAVRYEDKRVAQSAGSIAKSL